MSRWPAAILDWRYCTAWKTQRERERESLKARVGLGKLPLLFNIFHDYISLLLALISALFLSRPSLRFAEHALSVFSSGLGWAGCRMMRKKGSLLQCSSSGTCSGFNYTSAFFHSSTPLLFIPLSFFLPFFLSLSFHSLLIPPSVDDFFQLFLPTFSLSSTVGPTFCVCVCVCVCVRIAAAHLVLRSCCSADAHSRESTALREGHASTALASVSCCCCTPDSALLRLVQVRMQHVLFFPWKTPFWAPCWQSAVASWELAVVATGRRLWNVGQVFLPVK